MITQFYFAMKIGEQDAADFEMDEGVTLLVFPTKAARDNAMRVIKLPDLHNAADSSILVGETDDIAAHSALLNIMGAGNDDDDDDFSFDGDDDDGDDGDDDDSDDDDDDGISDIDDEDEDEEEEEGDPDPSVKSQNKKSPPTARNITSKNADVYTRNLGREVTKTTGKTK